MQINTTSFKAFYNIEFNQAVYLSRGPGSLTKSVFAGLLYKICKVQEHFWSIRRFDTWMGTPISRPRSFLDSWIAHNIGQERARRWFEEPNSRILFHLLFFEVHEWQEYIVHMRLQWSLFHKINGTIFMHDMSKRFVYLRNWKPKSRNSISALRALSSIRKKLCAESPSQC